MPGRAAPTGATSRLLALCGVGMTLASFCAGFVQPVYGLVFLFILASAFGQGPMIALTDSIVLREARRRVVAGERLLDYGAVHDTAMGNFELTGNPLDVMIDGPGYLAVEAGDGRGLGGTGGAQVEPAIDHAIVAQMDAGDDAKDHVIRLSGKAQDAGRAAFQRCRRAGHAQTVDGFARRGVDPRRLEQVLAQRAGRQQIRRLVRPQDRDRVRLEGDRDRREAMGSADAARLVDDGQVPTVHPVEIAEGHHTGLEALGCLGDVGPAMHAGESTNSRG